MPREGYKGLTLEDPLVAGLEQWKAELKMRSTPELLRAILRKKEQVNRFLYILRFSTPYEASEVEY